MDAGMAFALGFIAGGACVCLLQIAWKVNAWVERKVNEPASAPPKIRPPRGRSVLQDTPLPRGWPSTYPIPSDALPDDVYRG